MNFHFWLFKTLIGKKPKCFKIFPSSSGTAVQVWSKWFDALIVFLKKYLKKINFEKNQQHEILPSIQRVKSFSLHHQKLQACQRHVIDYWISAFHVYNKFPLDRTRGFWMNKGILKNHNHLLIRHDIMFSARFIQKIYQEMHLEKNH